jgi:hypothetical protein
MDPTQNLDQRTFAGPVLPGQRMNSAGVKFKIDVTQDIDRSEALRDSAKLNGRYHGTPSRFAQERIPGRVRTSFPHNS